jgi:hypothetical protein
MKLKLTEQSGKITLHSLIEKLWWDGERWVGYPPDTKSGTAGGENQVPAQPLKDGQG